MSYFNTVGNRTHDAELRGFKTHELCIQYMVHSAEQHESGECSFTTTVLHHITFLTACPK